jgi:hypothetical protein
MWQETFVTYFKVFPRHLPGRNAENHQDNACGHNSKWVTFKCRCDVLPPFWFTYVRHCLNFTTGESGIKIPCNIVMLVSGGRGHDLFSANVYTFRNVAKILQ